MDAEAAHEAGVGLHAASAAELEALMADLVRREREHELDAGTYRTVGVRALPQWSADGLEVAGERVEVVACPSVLAVREALVEHEGSEGRLLLLTDCTERELGLDVLARLARRRLHRLDPWETVKRLFSARYLDPRLTSRDELAGAIVQVAPPHGFPPVLAGVLERETALATIAERAFEMPHELELPTLLRWTAHGAGSKRLASAPAAVREELRIWLSNKLGPPTSAIMDAIEAGHGDDVVPIGLVCEVVFSADAEGASERHGAAIRLETFVGGRPLEPTEGRAWAGAAASALNELDGHDAARVLRRADELLADIKVGEYAFLSGVLSSGCDQRLDRYAETLAQALGPKTTDNAYEELDRRATAVASHRGGSSDEVRSTAVLMSARLASWLRERPEERVSFADAAAWYADEGSLVDRARVAIREGESRPLLAQAFGTLGRKIDEEREEQNERFARHLAGWLEAPAASQRLIPGEMILHDVAAAAAAERLVAVVVLDALSYAVWRELAPSVEALGFREIIPEEAGGRLSGVALLPSVTTVSRTSLFRGTPAAGTATDEKKGFRTHRRLTEVSGSKRPPILFHKNELVSTGGSEIAEAVTNALADPEQRLVGVVVNAIDDVLAKGDQLRTRWTVDLIRPLDPILDAARDAGRCVVIASDHGHIIEWDMSYRRTGTFAERWRPADSEPEPGEVLLAGSRVLKGDGRIIAPWSEGLRYTPRKHGYHGGATPQEMITPIAVLTPDDAPPAGWKLLDDEAPAWWEGRSMVAEAAPPDTSGEEGRLFPIE